MRVAAMIVGAEMLVITLTPNLAGQQTSAAAQTVNFVPTAVKLEDLDQPTASKWRTISAFPTGMDYFFVPKPIDANGLARRDFSVDEPAVAPMKADAGELLGSANDGVASAQKITRLMARGNPPACEFRKVCPRNFWPALVEWSGG